MGRLLKIAAIGLLMGTWVVLGAAEEVTKEHIKGLDRQVQDIKKEVIEISTGLIQIEEKYISPPDSQVLIFLAMDQEEIFQSASVIIRIDGKAAVNHAYTFKELEALRRGGVQRIYSGNVRGGEHVLEMTLMGKLSNNKDVKQTASYKFTKDKGARILEIFLADPDSGNQGITFRD